MTPDEGPENVESSRTDDIAAAFEHHEAETPEVEQQTAAPTDTAAPATEGDPSSAEKDAAADGTRSRDATGRFAPRSGAKTPVDAAPAAPTTEQATAPTVDRLAKAPASWKAEEHAHWTAMPAAAREAVMRREVETNRALQESAEARKGLHTLQETISPYLNNIRAANTDPVTAIKTFFGYDNTLRHGTNLEKAQAITGLIKAYNVDIEALDSTLAGVAPAPEHAQQNAIQQALQRELAPMREFLASQQRAQAAASEQTRTTVATDLQRFASENPHYQAVRMDMADLLDLAAARGKQITLKEAYEAACWQSPQIRSILMVEQSRSAGETRNTAAQRARNAAVSVRTTPVTAAGSASAKGRSRVDDIAAAFDAQAGQE